MNITDHLLPVPRNSSIVRPYKPQFIVLHWTASTTIEGAYNTLNKVGTSYHYMIDGDQVWKLVDEKRTAFHAGVWAANLKSIGISCVGIWEQPIKTESYNSLVELIVDICRRYGINPSEDTIRMHKQFKATACPGTLNYAWVVGEVRKQLLTPQEVPQPQEGYPKQVEVDADIGVNFRTAPRMGAPVIRAFKKGNKITAIGREQGDSVNGNDQWYRLEYFGTYGYSTVVAFK